eukprot:9326596-Alexandrium_andersonii.AAC.1
MLLGGRCAPSCRECAEGTNPGEQPGLSLGDLGSPWWSEMGVAAEPGCDRYQRLHRFALGAR